MPLIKHTTVNVQPSPVTVADAVNVVVKAEPIKPENVVTDKKMTNADWAAKDRRISRQGLFQAALQSPALMQYAPTLEEYMALVRKTADEGLVYVNEAAQ